jgi:hypothetical protein
MHREDLMDVANNILQSERSESEFSIWTVTAFFHPDLQQGVRTPARHEVGPGHKIQDDFEIKLLCLLQRHRHVYWVVRLPGTLTVEATC